LGTKGLRDWTLDETHLCNIRLRLLRLNTMRGLDGARLADVTPLEKLSDAELQELGRLPYPMIRHKGERGFSRIDWADALAAIGTHVGRSSPDRLGFYMTSRGQPNENYYAAQ
jgi:anaerobic selenocysteine-containing dehydrogenase